MYPLIEYSTLQHYQGSQLNPSGQGRASKATAALPMANPPSLILRRHVAAPQGGRVSDLWLPKALPGAEAIVTPAPATGFVPERNERIIVWSVAPHYGYHTTLAAAGPHNPGVRTVILPCSSGYALYPSAQMALVRMDRAHTRGNPAK